MKILITFLLLFVSLKTFSQTLDSLAIQQLQQTVKQLQDDFNNQKKRWKNHSDSFTKKLSVATDSIALLHSQIEIERAALAALADSLGIRIDNTQTNADRQIQGVQETIDKNTLHWIIAVLAIVLLSLSLFWILNRRLKTDRTSLVAQLMQTKTGIEEQLVKEYSKQAEVIDSLLKTLRELPIMATGGEPDHSLALKLADEITLMERNLSLMDASTKGLKQLNRSIGKLKDNLAANGYEIPELMGKSYNEGMKVIVINSTYDEKLQEDKKIISKIIKPQVNYKDKMIQAAQIELNVG
jgi:hypothetical protein